MYKAISTKTALRLYAANPELVGGFGQDFGNLLQALDKYSDNPKLASFSYRFLNTQRNIQGSVHGGALVTMVDVATTIGITRLTPKRTISVSLQTDFLNVIKQDQLVEIESEVTKIGKSLVFTDCRIYTQPHGQRKLACNGKHVKFIFDEDWAYMKLPLLD